MMVYMPTNQIHAEISRLETERENLDKLYLNHTDHFEKQLLIERIAYTQGQIHVWRELAYKEMANG